MINPKITTIMMSKCKEDQLEKFNLLNKNVDKQIVLMVDQEKISLKNSHPANNLQIH